MCVVSPWGEREMKREHRGWRWHSFLVCVLVSFPFSLQGDTTHTFRLYSYSVSKNRVYGPPGTRKIRHIYHWLHTTYNKTHNEKDKLTTWTFWSHTYATSLVMHVLLGQAWQETIVRQNSKRIGRGEMLVLGSTPSDHGIQSLLAHYQKLYQSIQNK